MDIDLKGKASQLTGKAGGLWSEFKKFAFKGNMIDLAIAVVLGAAIAKVIDSIVKNIIMELVSYLDFGTSGGYTQWHLGKLKYGLVLADLLNFIVVAGVIFIVVVKIFGAIMKQASPPSPAGEPTTKECPLCLMTVPFKARRCGHCTSDLPEIAPAAAVISN